jgi:two-component system, NarL family, response regulator LiaR
MTNPLIRILIAADRPIVRDSLLALLSTQNDFRVVATVGDGEAVLHQVSLARPHVILLDLEMPCWAGVVTLQRLTNGGELLPTIVFTAFDTDARIMDAVRAGARGYLTKGAPREELFSAIRVIHRGGSLPHPLAATQLHNHLPPAPPAPSNELTARELEVLHLVAQGRPNKEIAARLVITERTAKFHVSSLIGKLGAANRTELVMLANQRGLLKY